jgi:hypothetical protein
LNQPTWIGACRRRNILHRRRAHGGAVAAAAAAPALRGLLEVVGGERLRERADVEHEVGRVLHDDAVDAPVEEEHPHRDAAEVPDAAALHVAVDPPPVREPVPAVDVELAVPAQEHLERAVRRPVRVPRHALRQDAPREPEPLQHLVRARLARGVAGRGRQDRRVGLGRRDDGEEEEDERQEAAEAARGGHGGGWFLGSCLDLLLFLGGGC